LLQKYSDKTKLNVKNQDEVHELISWEVILHNKELARLLSEEDREHIVGLLRGDYGFSLYKDIVSGPVDVDKQDYLLRDSHFCGVKYGLYDQGRLTDTLLCYEDADDLILALSPHGKHTLEQFVLARYYMHTQVYRHKIRLITDGMIHRGILLGIEEDKIDWLKDLYSFDGTPEFLEDYLTWYDDRLFSEILRPETHDGYAKMLFQQLQDRRLFKMIFEAQERDFENPEIRKTVFGDSNDFFGKLEEKIAAAYSFDKNLVIVQRLSFKPATRTEKRYCCAPSRG
jgi:HD superfamily phosphohydrolase